MQKNARRSLTPSALRKTGKVATDALGLAPAGVEEAPQAYYLNVPARFFFDESYPELNATDLIIQEESQLSSGPCAVLFFTISDSARFPPPPARERGGKHGGGTPPGMPRGVFLFECQGFSWVGSNIFFPGELKRSLAPTVHEGDPEITVEFTLSVEPDARDYIGV